MLFWTNGSADGLRKMQNDGSCTSFQMFVAHGKEIYAHVEGFLAYGVGKGKRTCRSFVV